MTEQNHEDDGSSVDIAEKAVEVLSEIIQRMGYDFDVQQSAENGRIELEIAGDEAGELIGSKGNILDSLQFLLGRILQKLPGGRQPISVDNGGYRKRRGEALQQMAGELAEKAQELGQTLAINPMSAHDRRIIHMTLRDMSGVSTQSEGEGTMRRVLIVPQG